ncbi:hypothetical protein Q5752_006090 [Cryptotrichosporon argae]
MSAAPLLTPPLTPASPFAGVGAAPAPLAALDEMPELAMPEPSLPLPGMSGHGGREAGWAWREGMSAEERQQRRAWLAGGRGRKGLRIVIVTENFLPKVDGVTRTLARLLEHLEREGHSCMLLGPGTGMTHYASHPLVGTLGLPLILYPGLKLNFLRPKFLRAIRDFQPDVVHFVDPIWLGAQTLVAMELGWAGDEWVAPGGPTVGGGINGAVVASYHTNLATYATLFGLPWLTPLMWRLQQKLYGKARLTLCPSPSTAAMLRAHAFAYVRLWPRGVDLVQFGPARRSARIRADWGVGDAPVEPAKAGAHAAEGTHHTGRKTSLPLTPPSSPYVAAADGPAPVAEPAEMPARVVVLYVGRISWEKNIMLLLHAYEHLVASVPAGALPPKLVFVGDGPARGELEALCARAGYDATFLGFRAGAELAACYASADVFAFPSFTETFGQVVLEALASGLPVVGLDAEGTRDLVAHAHTGWLLTAQNEWHAVCKDAKSPEFDKAAQGYAELLRRATEDHAERRKMGVAASTEGIKGFTWWDAMEKCVDGYRESIRMARATRAARAAAAADATQTAAAPPSSSSSPWPSSPPVSRVNRAVSARLAYGGKWAPAPGAAARARSKSETAENLWHVQNVVKAVLAVWLGWYVWHWQVSA